MLTVSIFTVVVTELPQNRTGLFLNGWLLFIVAKRKAEGDATDVFTVYSLLRNSHSFFTISMLKRL